jgi:hypothetical protein
MWRKVLTIFTALALGAILFSNHSWAACTQDDLQGTWRVYTISADRTGSFWLYGTVVVNSDGTIKSGTTFTSDTNDRLTVKGGQLTLSSGCKITGKIELSGGINVNVKQGALTEDGEQFSMVYKSNSVDPGMAIGIKK